MTDQLHKYFSGIDLGQAQDFTALVTTRQVPSPNPTPKRKHLYQVCFLKSWDLGTDYIQICNDCHDLYEKKPLTKSHLAVDFTGVGRAVANQLRAAKVNARKRLILVTGGNDVKVDEDEPDEYHVPKRELVGTLVALAQSDLIKVSPHCDPRLLARIKKELQDFKTKLSRRSNAEQFGAWADGQHDDLVFALMMAVWIGETCGSGSVRDIRIPRGQSAVEKAPDGVYANSGD